jgi:hypothetical protein
MGMKVRRARKLVRLCVVLSVTIGITAIVGCENKPTRAKSGATGSITASPNPIQVCDGSGLGVANISWSFTGAKLVEVRVGSPDGGLLAQAGGDGTKSTGKWVGTGSVFYLQDVSNGLPLTADNTIATVTISVTTAGCP